MPVTVPPRLRRHRPGQLTLALPRVPGCCGHPELAAHPESDSRLDTESDTGPLPRIPDPGTDRPAGPRRGQRGTTRPGHPRPRDNRPPRQQRAQQRRVAAPVVAPAVPPTGVPADRPPRRALPPRPDLEMPRHVDIHLERLDGTNRGKLRWSSPQARGTALVTRHDPDQIAQALIELSYLAAEQGHAVWSGSRTVHDQLTEWDDPTEPPRPKVTDADELAERAARKTAISYASDAVCRPDQASPELWSADPPEWVKGVLTRPWRSPNGRRWIADSVIGPLLEKRARLGLPLTYEEQCGEPAPVDDEAPRRRLAVVG